MVIQEKWENVQNMMKDFITQWPMRLAWSLKYMTMLNQKQQKQTTPERGGDNKESGLKKRQEKNWRKKFVKVFGDGKICD